MSVIEVITTTGNHHHLFTKCDICKTTINFFKPENYNITGTTLAFKNTKNICSKCKKKK
jgi:hypothetical protein